MRDVSHAFVTIEISNAQLRYHWCVRHKSERERERVNSEIDRHTERQLVVGTGADSQSNLFTVGTESDTQCEGTSDQWQR